VALEPLDGLASVLAVVSALGRFLEELEEPNKLVGAPSAESSSDGSRLRADSDRPPEEHGREELDRF
jgi:hypothetical protein